MNTLIIDTSKRESIKVGLKLGRKDYYLEKKADSQKAQIVLPIIDEILKKHKIELKDLNSIEVNTGPGSFTGLRVGISVANSLSFVLNIPVNNKKPGKFVEPIYQ